MYSENAKRFEFLGILDVSVIKIVIKRNETKKNVEKLEIPKVCKFSCQNLKTKRVGQKLEIIKFEGLVLLSICL